MILITKTSDQTRQRVCMYVCIYVCTYFDSIWCLLTGLLPISAAGSMYLLKPPYAIGSVSSLSGHAIAYRWRSQPRVAGTGPVVLKVVPVTGAAILQVTMDQLMRASLFSHSLLAQSGHVDRSSRQ